MKLKKVIYIGLAGLMFAGVGAASFDIMSPMTNAKRTHRSVHKRTKAPTVNANKKRTSKKSQRKNPALYMRKPISYTKSSETIPYPKHLSARKDRIVVSLKKQRAYIMRGKKLRYEFYVSTGKNVRGRRTPKGHYRINSYRAHWFYSPTEHEGAFNAVGWHDGGLYLFHETPSHHSGKIIKSVARELGKKGTSYGCVHLSVKDSKWFYHHAPTGMRVIIR